MAEGSPEAKDTGAFQRKRLVCFDTQLRYNSKRKRKS